MFKLTPGNLYRACQNIICYIAPDTSYDTLYKIYNSPSYDARELVVIKKNDVIMFIETKMVLEINSMEKHIQAHLVLASDIKLCYIFPILNEEINQILSEISE